MFSGCSLCWCVSACWNFKTWAPITGGFLFPLSPSESHSAWHWANPMASFISAPLHYQLRTSGMPTLLGDSSAQSPGSQAFLAPLPIGRTFSSFHSPGRTGLPAPHLWCPEGDTSASDIHPHTHYGHTGFLSVWDLALPWLQVTIDFILINIDFAQHFVCQEGGHFNSYRAAMTSSK